MSPSDQRLYRAQALEPVLGYDDVAMLIDNGGLQQKYDSAFFGVQGIRPALGFGPRGLFIIWTQGAAPAGYAPLPGGVPTGNIASGAAAQFANPVGLQLGSYQLLQVRFAVEVLALTGAVSLHDLDVQQSVGAINDLAIPAIPASGALNMIDQFQSPGDSIVDPAQNANKALPAAFPQTHPRDVANMTETYWFEQMAPTWTVTNRGGATITGGTVGLRFWGFKYFLNPLKPDDTWQMRWVAGDWRLAPPVQRIVTIPTVPPSGTVSF
jgi:hypothetical protein